MDEGRIIEIGLSQVKTMLAIQPTEFGKDKG